MISKYKIKKIGTDHGQEYVLYERVYFLNLIPYWREKATYQTYKIASTVKQRLEKWKNPLEK